MRADYHVHTHFSDDSEYRMEQVVEDAIALGIDELCFTDHVDYGVKKDADDPNPILMRVGDPEHPVMVPVANVDYPLYYETIRELQQAYGDRISLKLGLEFGVQRHTIEKYEKLFSSYPFDFIIMSVHEIDDLEFWNQKYQKGKTQREYNEGYYEALLELVHSYHSYSVLGHLDLIVRYDKAGVYPYKKVEPIIEEILKTVIADGKGIELNTSSHRYKLTDLTPSRDILRMYRQLGGEIITIGSDSHEPHHLGAYIDESREILKSLGYKYFCTYEKMEPRFHALL